MNAIANNQLTPEKGVLVSPAARKKYAEFEAAYLQVRSQEKRLLSIGQVRQLPYPDKSSPDFRQWKIRRENMGRFMRSLPSGVCLKILEVGCGNGYFSNLLSKSGHGVTGLDVNLYELQQAAEAFPADITWCCADLFDDELPNAPYDLIVFNASFHYFAEPALLIKRCQRLLGEGGEIHIMDSPFYTQSSVAAGRNRSASYFRNNGAERLVDYYHHHTLDFLSEFNSEILYRPGGWLKRKLGFGKSPFHWIKITGQE